MIHHHRRQFLKLLAAGTGSAFLSKTSLSMAQTRHTIKAMAFDGFPIFDPRPIFKLSQSLFPAKGKKLAQLWFTKIFAYTWLRTTAGQYKNLYSIIEDALTFSANSLNIKLAKNQRESLLRVWLQLPVWPDVIVTLNQLRKQGIRLAFLSNLTEEMLRINARNAGIEKHFEFYLSTDMVQAFKPHPRAYQMGLDAFQLPRENIAFVAFGGWDAAGAKWFGYPTLWVNRFNKTTEQLDTHVDSSASGLNQLVEFIQ